MIDDDPAQRPLNVPPVHPATLMQCPANCWYAVVHAPVFWDVSGAAGTNAPPATGVGAGVGFGFGVGEFVGEGVAFLSPFFFPPPVLIASRLLFGPTGGKQRAKSLRPNAILSQ